MTKQFEYRDHNFAITIKLKTRIERRINGECYHTVTIICLDLDNYYVKDEVSDKNLEQYLQDCEKLIKKYVDKKLDKSDEYQWLIDLGYEESDTVYAIKNPDVIDFRHEFIERIYAKNYTFGVSCNDGKTNVMTEDRKKVLEDVLFMFNNHFSMRNYIID